jgi:hypothetical protein
MMLYKAEVVKQDMAALHCLKALESDFTTP